MENSFTAVYEQLDNWYIGYVQELPGANVREFWKKLEKVYGKR
ncbi:hypothetical protein [Nostoc sp.]